MYFIQNTVSFEVLPIGLNSVRLFGVFKRGFKHAGIFEVGEGVNDSGRDVGFDGCEVVGVQNGEELFVAVIHAGIGIATPE